MCTLRCQRLGDGHCVGLLRCAGAELGRLRSEPDGRLQARILLGL